MPRRAGTQSNQELGYLFRRHRELVHPEITQEAAAEMAGVSVSVYDNIEKGRWVSLGSYRKAAKGLRLPGGIPRVETIFNGDPDPGPGSAVMFPEAFHPSANAETAQAGRLAELILRFESAMRTAEQQLDSQRAELETLKHRVADLESRTTTPPTPKPRRSVR